MKELSKTKETIHILVKKKGMIKKLVPWLPSIGTYWVCQAVLKFALHVKDKQQEKRNAVEDYTYKISFQFVYIILKLKKIQSIFNMSKRNHDDRQDKQAVGLESHFVGDGSVKLLR